jgi:hypothetical protein
MTNCTLIQKLRTPRFFNMAILDWILTLLGAYILVLFLRRYTYFKSQKFYKLLFYITIGLVILAIFLHWLFGINTVLGYYLSLNKMPDIIRCF